MDSSNEKKNDKKETIKFLTLKNVEGTETLYTRIPFFMRTRMEGLIDKIDWVGIKHGCDHGDLDCLNEAIIAYHNLLKKINEYLTLYTMTKKEAKTDDMMLMRTDLNFIKAEYGSDAVKFVKAMAECIQKEDELIENYEGKFWVIESAAVFNENLGIDMLPEMNSPVADPTVVEPEPDPIPEELINIGNEIALLKESLRHFQNGTHWQAYIENVEEPHHIILMSEDNLGDSLDQVQAIFNLFNTLSVMMSTYLGTLAKNVAEWRTASAKASVNVGPKTDEIKLEKSFSDFCQHLKDLLSLFHNKDYISKLRQTKTNEVALYQNQFENIKKLLFQCNLVVYTEPKDLMSIESVGSRKGKDDGAGPSSGTKAKRKYCTKKKNSFSTEVRLLGGQHFRIQFQTSTIELVAEKDLAEKKNGNADQSSQLAYKIKTNTDEAPHSVVFENVAIKSFCRVEQNHIYKQFFRLKYNLALTVDDSPYNLSILSQPFMFNTGSNQILELIAARMWYCANHDLYTGNFLCEDSLDVEVVLDMLDTRVANLHPNGSRSLFPHEREFLRSRLPNSGSGRITMQGFIKDKMKKTRNVEEELSFPFHTWFYAVLYSIQTHLLRPWVDGVIFGFCSESQAKEVLESQDVGTFIIRPSISRVLNSMSSREASADLTIDIKLYKDNPGPNEDRTHVLSIPLLMSSVINYSLYGAIAGIRKDNEPIAKYYLTNELKRKNIAHLRAYNKEKNKEEFIPDYGIVTEKIEQMIVKDSSSGEPNVEGARQRKRPCTNHSSVPMIAPVVPSQPTEVMDEAIENILEVYNFDDEATGQGHRSGHQSNCLPVPNEVESGNNKRMHKPGSAILRLDSGIEVDTSKLPNFGALQDQEEIASFILQQVEKQSEGANDFLNSLNCVVDPNSNLIRYDPHPNELLEISPDGSGISSFFIAQTYTTDNHHTNFNSNPRSNVSSSTTISSYNYSPSQDDMSWNSPSDSGIDRDHTPSPPNEETCPEYPIPVSRINLNC